MQFLKQSTAATIKLGPFVDDADGKTAETSLTISQADVRLSKNGGDMAQKSESSSATHDELGYYDVALNTTDTGTLGSLKVMVSESGALPVWAEFMVLPANVYDSLVSGSDALQVDTVQIAGFTQVQPGSAAGALPVLDALGRVDARVEYVDDGAMRADSCDTGVFDAITGNIDNNSTKLAAIVADTNELQTDWVNGGRLDLLIDALGTATTAIKAVTDLLPNGGALTTINNNAATAATQSTTAATQATTAATQATNALKKNTAYTVTTGNGELETTFSE